MNELNVYVQRVENAMEQYLKMMEAQSHNLNISELYTAMRHSLTAGGKRIRPVFVYAFCKACGGMLEKADAAACAMEMTHTSSLIFDDLPAMDNDDMRRGKPSCHKAFGEATAILAGDALICAPFTLISEDPYLSDQQKVALITELSRQEGVNGMVGGQMMDMQFETQDSVTAEELEIMCLGKTGALIAASCKMGCLCGNATAEQLQAAEAYGKSVGLAFQIVDDILDVIGNAETLGKPIGSDADEEKKTFVTILGIERAKAKAAYLTRTAHQQLEVFRSTEFLHKLTDALLVRMQ